MTDLETLFTCRLKKAEETLADAEMLLSGHRPRRRVRNIPSRFSSRWRSGQMPINAYPGGNFIS
jgi:hypothetical protein